MMKYLPNIISILRLILSPVLLLIIPFSSLFLILYLLIGFSDIVDGWLARKYHFTSPLGALLDSLGDFLFTIIMFIIIIPTINFSLYIVIWFLLVILLRVISLCIGCLKYHTFTFLHTYANKLTGLLLYSIPLLYYLIDINLLTIIILTVASFATVEENYILYHDMELNRDYKGIFFRE